MSIVQEWRDETLSNILSTYEAKDIFNADETALFWKHTPDQTLAFKGEKPEGRKKKKDRITILVTANMDGSDKLPLLFIGT